MSRGFSLYLDVLRLWAACMVLFAHWAFPRFTGEDHLWMRTHDLGGDGVVIFFVLSGLLISFAAERRAAEGAGYFAVDRFSRLWSVAIPALIFCYVLDVIGQSAMPEIYAAVGYEGGVSIEALVTGATFTNQLWFWNIQPGSNGPYWSLGYEAWYYLIFALFFFAKGKWRWILAGGATMIAGPKIALLAPSWLLGVWVWRVIKSGRLARLSRPMAWTFLLAPLGFYFLAHNSYLHWQLHAVTESWFGADGVAMLGPSDTFLWSAVLGVLTAAHVLGAAAVFSGEARSVGSRAESMVRWMAGGSFALYLIHFPVMHFAGALMPGGVGEAWRQGALLILPIVVAYVFAEVSERRRPALRAWMRARLARRRSATLSST